MSGNGCPGLLLVLEKAEGAATGTASSNSVLARKVKYGQDNMGWGHCKNDLFISIFITFSLVCVLELKCRHSGLNLDGFCGVEVSRRG